MRHYYCADRFDGKPLCLCQGKHFFEKQRAADVLIFVVAVGEEYAYIALVHSRQYGVHYRMYKHVAVAVRDKPFVVGNYDSAKYEVAPYVKSVSVPTVADPPLIFSQSAEVVTLIFSSLPSVR